MEGLFSDVRLSEEDVDVVVLCVFAGDGKSFIGDIYSFDVGVRPLFGECYCDAAAAGTEVKDVLWWCVDCIEKKLEQLFCFGSWNQCVLVNNDVASKEGCVADDILDRFILQEVVQCPVETEEVRLVDGMLSLCEEVDVVPSEEGVEENAEEHLYLTLWVEVAKPAEEGASDVVDLV
mgnify:CR=1 FL=1